jgi:N-acetylmuramoyl-L-alanine amidase
MVQKFSLLLLSIILIFGAVLPPGKSMAATGSYNTVAIADIDQLRVRSGPGTSFRVIGFINKGQKFTVLGQNENWYKINSPFGEGWVVRDFLEIKTIKQESKQDNSGTKNNMGMVNGDTLNIRQAPSTTSPVIGKLTKGTSVSIYSKQNNWVEVGFSNLRGWVSSEFIDSQTTGVSTGKTQSTKNGISGTVTANSLSIRAGASLNTKLLGTVTKGLSFTILEEKYNWAKIEYKTGSFGWVAGWYLDKKAEKSQQSGQDVKESLITIIHNGTNIRKGPDVQSAVVERANKGLNFSVKSVINDWYEIKLKNGQTGYVAGWLVSINGSKPQIEKPGAEGYLKNKTIVLDPGHGGGDKGASGAGGTYEKVLTLRTAQLLFDKLKAAGANVYVTRKNDSYLQLASRVNIARTYNADAFISLHYDSNLDRSVRGMTGYYYHSNQKALADSLFASTIGQTKLQNRGVRFGDYHVLRENSQSAVLMELGYLSNPEEELTLKSSGFQENAASGLFYGLARYFKAN